MRRNNKPEKSHKTIMQRLLAVVLMVTILAVLLSVTVFAQNSYVITDGDNVTVYQSYSSDPDKVLEEAGIELSKEDTYTTTYNDGVGRINIQRMQMVTILNRGSQLDVGSYGETVGELFDRLGITIGANDLVSCEMDSQTYDGMTISIVNKEIEVFEYDAVVPYETKYYEDPSLAPGEEIVLIQGVNGVIHYEMQVTEKNGVEVSREVLNENVKKEVVNELVIRGPRSKIPDEPEGTDHKLAEGDAKGYTLSTDGSNTITTDTGTVYTYTDTIHCLATAYACDGYIGHNYSGAWARVGTIAVDPKLIPLGTKMYVVSDDGEFVYGFCVAEDIGGGIKGHRIDLYFDSFEDCAQFGARDCTVYILKDEEG